MSGTQESVNRVVDAWTCGIKVLSEEKFFCHQCGKPRHLQKVHRIGKKELPPKPLRAVHREKEEKVEEREKFPDE